MLKKFCLLISFLEKKYFCSETYNTNSADNEVTFNQPNETTTHATQTANTADTTVTTTKEEITTQSVTDKDGWINKWY